MSDPRAVASVGLENSHLRTLTVIEIPAGRLEDAAQLVLQCSAVRERFRTMSSFSAVLDLASVIPVTVPRNAGNDVSENAPPTTGCQLGALAAPVFRWAGHSDDNTDPRESVLGCAIKREEGHLVFDFHLQKTMKLDFASSTHAVDGSVRQFEGGYGVFCQVFLYLYKCPSTVEPQQHVVHDRQSCCTGKHGNERVSEHRERYHSKMP